MDYDALMCFLFLLVYVLIFNNDCMFLTNSKNSKSNDNSYFHCQQKNGKSGIRIYKQISGLFFLKG